MIPFSIPPWTQDGSPGVITWGETVPFRAPPRTQIESPDVNTWREIVPFTALPWTQAEGPDVNTQRDTVPFTGRTQAESTAVHTGRDTVPFTAPPWTQDKGPDVNNSSEVLSFTGPSLAHAKGPALNNWRETVPIIGSSWTQAENPTVNAWRENMPLTAPPWSQVEHPAINTWRETVPFTEPPWTQAEYPAVNTWRETVPFSALPWTQAESPAVNTWREAMPFTDPSWIQEKSPTVNSWRQIFTFPAQPWPQTESTVENDWIWNAPFTAPPWSHTESSAVNTWTEPMLFIAPPWTEAENPATNTWKVNMHYRDTLWPQSDFAPANPWTSTESFRITSWTHTVKQVLNIWTEPIASTATLWTQAEYSTPTYWTEIKAIYIVTPLTQYQFSINTLTKSVGAIITLWTSAESLSLSSFTQNSIDTIEFWPMLKTESKKRWNLPQTSTFMFSLNPQIDTFGSLNQIENQESPRWAHPEIDNANTMAFLEFGTLISQVVPLPQAARLWPQTEAANSKIWFVSSERINSWDQSESQRMSTSIHFGVGRVKPLAQHETAIVMSWLQIETGIFHPWNKSEGGTGRFWPLSETEDIREWIQTGASTVNSWTQLRTNIVRAWPQAESELVRPWTQAKTNAITLLTQTDAIKPWFQTKINSLREGTQTQSQIVTTWIQTQLQIFHPWIQPKSDSVRFWTQPWIQAETHTVRLYYEIDVRKSWASSESQSVTFWSLSQNSVRTSFHFESQMTCSWVRNEFDIISPWNQYETSSVGSWIQSETGTCQPWFHIESSTITPWTQYETLEISPSTHPETDTAIRHLFQPQIDPISTWNQPEVDTIRFWTQVETETIPIWIQIGSQVVKPPNFSEVGIVTPWLKTETDAIRPWIQSDFQSIHPSTQTGFGIIDPWFQPRASVNQPWTFVQTQSIRPWIKVESNTIKSWFHVPMKKVRLGIPSESQILSFWLQSDVSRVNAWIQPETQAVNPGAHPKTGNVASLTIPKPERVRMWIQPEREMRPGIIYKTNITTSFASEIEPDGTISHFDSWANHVTFLPIETVPSLDEHFAALSTEIAAVESQGQINPVQPSEITNIIFLTVSSTQLPGGAGYLNFGNKLQITNSKGSPNVPSSSLNPLFPSFSFIVPCFFPFSCSLSLTCSVFSSCTFSSPCTFPSCSVLPIVGLSPVPPLAASDSSLQKPSSSKVIEDTILSHTFSSFHAAPATLLTKQPSLMPGFQLETKSNQPEQDLPKYSELNISLAECRLGVVWKESLQAFSLFKTAVISHEITECGLRPGLVPHCPNCWEAEVGEFPWMVSVQLSFSHFCAGSILNEQWILTTARCANFIKNSEALAHVQVGLIDLQDPAQAQTIGIHRAMPYLGPRGPLGPGLIFLKQPLHFQPLVLPICLEESLEQEKNIQLYDCWLPSWSLMRGSPGILQKRHLSILQAITCAQFWPKLNEFTFCVAAKKAMGEAGCKGDLGAPLVCHLQQKDTWVQVGILTHFDEHCTKPYVFSQVSPFLFWLQGVTRPSQAPWSKQGPMTTSASVSLSVSTSTNASAFTSTPASVRPHFISLPQPQTLADRISLRYAMPWQAMIISCGSQICSGSIVSSSWVLTAAHCVRNMNPEDTAVILGLRHPGAPLRVVKISTILLHERFRLVSRAARNDLALLLLQEVQTPIQILAPLGHLKNLNSSECWLSGPRILKPGETDENPEILQMKVIGASSCAHLYPDIGSSIVCFITQDKDADTNVEPVSPGSAVMCRPMSRNGSWRQIGLTSLKALATIVSPHFSWILSTSSKAGHPLNHALMPWMEKPKSSSLVKQPTTLPFCSTIIVILQRLS
ncbi:uncharacterized protein LOC132658999 [Ovis aries]|uniref:uncharacterized protein LOC132658999 n=1 Tax=Ovis aries TaxID=9940 RepID=UPI002952927F|nr:uncharacterized protein LOC132658999 [Ovis aries]